jgi:hypothetical protein
MSEHYTRSTVTASAWCRKCQKPTMHRIDDRRVGPCLDCIARRERESAELKMERAEYARQRELFG